MKIEKAKFFQLLLFLGGSGLLVLMIINYQKKQATIISEKQKEIATELAIEQKEQLTTEKINGQIFYDLSLMGIENFQPTAVAISQTNQWAFLDENSQKIVVLNQENKKFAAIALPLSASKTSALTWNNETLVVYAGALYQYQEKKQLWNKLTPDFGEGEMNLLEKFDLNYYLLGANSLQKIIFTTRGWQKTESWLAEGETKGAVPIGMWIDGSIYISDQTTGVKQFSQGKATTWKIKENLIPPLYLAKNGEDFIILAPQMKTVFRFDKNGERLAFFQNENLAGCQFIWLKDKSFLTIKNNLIYNYNLP